MSRELAQTTGIYGSKILLQVKEFYNLIWEQHTQTNEFYNWDDMKNKIRNNGIRNSLLVAPMPTASTSQILGFNECIEPITSNIYSGRTSAGEFVLANKYMMMDLIKLDLWNEDIKNNIIANNGSIQ